MPSRTGVNISVETYKQLSRIDNIIAVKEASGNFSQMAKIASVCGDDLYLYSGNDDQVTSALALGAKGVISVPVSYTHLPEGKIAFRPLPQ